MTAPSRALGTAMLTMIASGCAATAQHATKDKEYPPPTSIYNILDGTALVYSDPAAGSAVNDHPLRWLGFLSHPLGHAADYGLNRPTYKFGSSIPYLFDYTAEDNLLDAQRR